jgi:flagellar biosynthesis protein FliQ
MQLLLEHVGQGLALSLVLSLPAVLVAAGIGLVVGILQAVTQVQEQTIAAAPKILGVFLMLLLGGGLMMTMLENYVRESFQIAFNEIPQEGKFILPPRLGKTESEERARRFFKHDGAPERKPPASGRLDAQRAGASAFLRGDSKGSGAASMLKVPAKRSSGDALSLSEQLMRQKRGER